ncbi:putative hsp70 family chaperone [Diaporthe ampelina]|uniref:Putative hsp70 family chaperone n=1 Tax=Diaporthe ampelina TaxID=1214573 RepID=A0A0G2HUT6_9PEZI|nr:putative hsp70 family chaperone [Diaporthe ampelina]
MSGVAWARPQATNALQSPIQVIHNWPGCSTRNEQKVPTCLVYGRHERPTSWGFICEDDDDFETKRREFFKIFLDKMNLLEAQIKGLQGAPESVAQAQKFVTDYLSEVYVHVKSTIEHQTGIGPFTGWKDLAVEFLFSVPTTWRSFKIINTFKEAIKNAGFGAEGPRHVATVDLTESEAAAVATIKSTAITFEKDDIFLSVDAGGGTTDFALMQVVETKEPFPTLKQLTQVDGVGIGSTLIDRAFLDLVEDRVFPFSELVDQLPPDCIEKLVRSDKFRTAKHKFGERVYNAAVYKLPMEGVGEDMQSIFDPHINSMLKKIREQLDFVRLKAFGNPQVQDLSLNPHPNAVHIKIVQAHDPQLVVVKGLILDRLQKLESGDKPVLATRKARASYGVMCKMKYNPQIHFQEELKTDPLDGQVYAMSQIDWLIRKGDDIDPNLPIISTFNQKIAKGSTLA